jgi:hypothetical protein
MANPIVITRAAASAQQSRHYTEAQELAIARIALHVQRAVRCGAEATATLETAAQIAHEGGLALADLCDLCLACLPAHCDAGTVRRILARRLEVLETLVRR